MTVGVTAAPTETELRTIAHMWRMILQTYVQERRGQVSRTVVAVIEFQYVYVRHKEVATLFPVHKVCAMGRRESIE